jgi:hypothetical protein
MLAAHTPTNTRALRPALDDFTDDDLYGDADNCSVSNADLLRLVTPSGLDPDVAAALEKCDAPLTPPPPPVFALAPPPPAPRVQRPTIPNWREMFGANAAGFAVTIMQSAVFAARKREPLPPGERPPTIDVSLETLLAPLPIRYRGPQLTQDHLECLLSLAQQAQGAEFGIEMSFFPRRFAARVLDWSDSQHSRDLVRACFSDMVGSSVSFPVWNATTRQWDWADTVLVASVEPDGSRLVVTMPATAARLFSGPQARLDLAARRTLNPGLDTWLHGLVSSCRDRERSFGDEQLRRLSGYPRPLKAFRRDVRKSLEKLVKHGAIVSYTIDRSVISYKPHA